jgi:hypothetical protein
MNISNGMMVMPSGKKYAFWHDGHACGFYGMDIGPVGTMVMPAGSKMERTSVIGSEYDGYAFW